MVALRDVEGFSQALAREFKPQRIVLFGSSARGDAGDASDVDLLVTMEYGESRLQCRRRFDNAVKLPVWKC